MPAETDRPQDVGRKHRSTRDGAAATGELLDRFQGAMRSELERLLVELTPKPKAGGLGLTGEPIVETLTISERTKRWELAIKLSTALGAAIDVPAPAATRGRSSSVDGPRAMKARDW